MKTLTLVACSIFASASCFASHLMGGQITAASVGGRTYAVTLTLYRDVLGIPLEQNATINYSDSSGSFTQAPPATVTPFLNGTEEWTYIDTVTFPADGHYTIVYSSCCRNAAVLNTSPNNITLRTELLVDSANPNSTPVFLNKPITLAGINNLWTYLPMPYDADGDSVAWRLIDPAYPYSGSSSYVPPFADSTQPFTMDSLTGQIDWIPNTLGNFVAVILAEEFRNGVKIGEIRRDMQMIVVAYSGSRATLNSSNWTENALGYFQFELTADRPLPFHLPVTATDPDGSALELILTGEPFQLEQNPATVYSTAQSPGFAQTDISWSPHSSQARSAVYLVSVRCNETQGPQVISNDLLLFLHVNHPTGIDEYPQSLAGPVFPSPVRDHLMIPVSLAHPEKVEVSILDALGRQVVQPRAFTLNAGNQVIKLDGLALSNGCYFARIFDGESSVVQRFIFCRD